MNGSKVVATDVTYELQTLGWKAFQKLCTTITSEIWGQTIQSFFDSYDGGRDGAFTGQWQNKGGETFSGSFTVQCKFTAKADVQIKLSDLIDEYNKVLTLSKDGLADNYFIFTNYKLTGTNERAIRKKFETIDGVKCCRVFGYERICEIIRESRKLRMLVPRIYGLGDLSQILDERAYQQSQEILSSLGDDLRKFIITDAYLKSAQAISEHGFVLLLGDPMCGKSTIAAALCMGSLDNWGCSTLKINNAEDFKTHYNPNEKQLFWVDDAFGPTQFDWSSAIAWNRIFPLVKAAINKGSKVIFTSRTYVYQSAKRVLKESSLPVLKESQVVIQVEKLTLEEKEQILYNHIKLGNQSTDYKSKIKPLLNEIAAHESFSPEIARRFGTRFFTEKLTLERYAIIAFLERPTELLCEIIDTLDTDSRAALAAVFMSGGNLPSPIQLSDDEYKAVTRVGGSPTGIVRSLEALNGSVVINNLNSESYCWGFKHPTVRDAYASLVAKSPDLMDIYLTGAPLEKLFTEISCGPMEIQGARVLVPKRLFSIVIEKIRTYDLSKWYNQAKLHRFLAYRCDRAFLEEFLQNFNQFVPNLHVRSYIYASSEIDVAMRLKELDILDEEIRLRMVGEIKELAVETPDSGFLRDDVAKLLLPEETSDILNYVRQNLIGEFVRVINEWRSNYSEHDEPSSHFEELTSCLNDYKEAFKEDEIAQSKIAEALAFINETVEELAFERNNELDFDSLLSSSTDVANKANVQVRSIFDDVDI